MNLQSEVQAVTYVHEKNTLSWVLNFKAPSGVGRLTLSQLQEILAVTSWDWCQLARTSKFQILVLNLVFHRVWRNSLKFYEPVSVFLK